mmetsp:Transcript_104502/g.248692  ORF Transcript_104502/g.248692 Transcript_104502/m.248692 type:complete len:220 (+) Transcript_104502:721-1380(+)
MMGCRISIHHDAQTETHSDDNLLVWCVGTIQHCSATADKAQQGGADHLRRCCLQVHRLAQALLAKASVASLQAPVHLHLAGNRLCLRRKNQPCHGCQRAANQWTNPHHPKRRQTSIGEIAAAPEFAHNGWAQGPVGVDGAAIHMNQDVDGQEHGASNHKAGVVAAALGGRHGRLPDREAEQKGTHNFCKDHLPVLEAWCGDVCCQRCRHVHLAGMDHGQ